MRTQFPEIRQALAGRFDVTGEIGRGVASVVFGAHDRKSDRDVALKILKPEVAQALGPERFLREIDIAAGLDHPSIIPLLDSGLLDGCLFYTMPLVAGESLERRIASQGALALDQALAVTGQVAAALDYAHAQGIIHRDITPGNILLDGTNARVTDFGFAMALDQAGGPLTPAGLVVGTPAYRCPEQSCGVDSLTGAADVYALGCVLYEMLAGEPPFSAATVQALVAKHSKERPTSIATVREGVPKTVEHAVLRALEKRPLDRYASAGGMCDEWTQNHTYATEPLVPE